MLVLGIVGSPAGGKSTVAAYLQEQGAAWIDADLIARNMLELPEIRLQLAGYFGPQVIAADGNVARGEIASLVFGQGDQQRAALRFLESIVHPPTRNEMMRQLKLAAEQRTPVAILDVPLMFKSGWDLGCDQIWCIDSPRQQRLARAASRGWDEAEMARREANQTPIEVKSRLSNLVVWNDSTLDALGKKIENVWGKLATMKAVKRGQSDKHCLTDISL